MPAFERASPENARKNACTADRGLSFTHSQNIFNIENTQLSCALHPVGLKPRAIVRVGVAQAFLPVFFLDLSPKFGFVGKDNDNGNTETVRG